ncbi:hypothetical protein [Ureibacillus manganicus]|uniref:Uncharacterized protein n=1 Tax=Ureibacillus manganicus DSM 26584 TaxID=1384049 RepID=A0A0A3I733_9BACL|nr:hypothetical protein [Ureibacillus manganicus]KGR78528.1 hypothetical protein CD29_10805 [Ureibacillus manganicus DSM 26584]
MFFQAILKKQIENDTKKDLYEQLQFTVVTLLNRELPTHYQGNHILYTANLRLAELKELALYHRKKIDMYTEVGQFHNEAYEMTIKLANQLELTIDSYIALHIDSDRDRINRRLGFMKDKIETVYEEFIEFNKQKVLPKLQESYWSALKKDLMPILAELR